MRLNDLCQIHDSPQLLGRLGDTHGQDGVTRFGGGNRVAYRTNAADTRHQAGHFVEAPPFAELLEPTELGGVKEGGVYCSLVVQVESDLGVAFDPRDWINDDLSGHVFLHPSMLQTGTWR